MDRFSHYYGWFVLAATALPALMRIAIPRQVAEMTCERINDDKKRRRYRMYGILSVVGSIVLLPIYVWYSQKMWLLVGFGLGLLTGVEMVGNAAAADANQMTRQNRVFGAAYAVACVAVYFLLIRP